MTNPFENIKFHPSMIGNLMTSLDQITTKQLQRLDELNARRLGAGRPLTALQNLELDSLLEKRDAPAMLPIGCVSALDEIYRAVVWRRKAIIDTKFMEKGSLVEQDCLDLLSRADNKFYAKNDDTIENEYLIGTPDHIGDVVIDTKGSWSLDSFDMAKLTGLYAWQIKGYLWILVKNQGRLVYCLVNAPGHLVRKEIERKWYYYGQPDQNNLDWIGVVQQIERNMIFDFSRFRYEHPNFDLETKTDDDTIPERFRIKSFNVVLTDDDIENMISRLQQCRFYLSNRFESDFPKF